MSERSLAQQPGLDLLVAWHVNVARAVGWLSQLSGSEDNWPALSTDLLHIVRL